MSRKSLVSQLELIVPSYTINRWGSCWVLEGLGIPSVPLQDLDISNPHSQVEWSGYARIKRRRLLIVHPPVREPPLERESAQG